MQHSSKHQPANFRKRAVVEVSPFSFIYFVFYFSGGKNCVSLKNLRTKVVDSSRAPLLFLMVSILILLISCDIKVEMWTLSITIIEQFNVWFCIWVFIFS